MIALLVVGSVIEKSWTWVGSVAVVLQNAQASCAAGAGGLHTFACVVGARMLGVPSEAADIQPRIVISLPRRSRLVSSSGVAGRLTWPLTNLPFSFSGTASRAVLMMPARH